MMRTTIESDIRRRTTWCIDELAWTVAADTTSIVDTHDLALPPEKLPEPLNRAAQQPVAPAAGLLAERKRRSQTEFTLLGSSGIARKRTLPTGRGSRVDELW
jgi:hypothetical protein